MGGLSFCSSILAVLCICSPGWRLEVLSRRAARRALAWYPLHWVSSRTCKSTTRRALTRPLFDDLRFLVRFWRPLPLRGQVEHVANIRGGHGGESATARVAMTGKCTIKKLMPVCTGGHCTVSEAVGGRDWNARGSVEGRWDWGSKEAIAAQRPAADRAPSLDPRSASLTKTPLVGSGDPPRSTSNFAAKQSKIRTSFWVPAVHFEVIV